ncbi:serine/threonine-protein kinase [Actinomadura macrotermitis]|uniref:non-specific serine/threonine protein kinase n=1 Tax=Actinomadura macrotermitis TaxID=2585200 RepID=A0A7K0BQW5_9ACTN|nr:Serine/threonine-protein kinase PknD [Actinomadura macrotermitis]
MTAAPPWRLQGFTEVRELGAGAQGRVVLARHATAGTPVAIKYLYRGDPAALDRLRAEAEMLGRVGDPHVVRLFRFVRGEQGAALVMEAVDGVSLRAVLDEHGALAPEAALTVLKGSLLGLAAAHAAGVVHRDYKPANVVVRADGLSKLIDFGIATVTGAESRSGTPFYMAPEQWEGAPASPATDVYAATCVFFECVTGGRPFQAANQAALMNLHLTAPPPADRLPPPLRPLLERGMAKRAEERPAGAAEFARELEAAASAAYGPDWERRGLQLAGAATVGLAALFPLLAAGLAPGGAVVGGTAAGGAGAGAAVAGGTAAAGSGTAAAGSGAAAGGGLLAATGAKVAIGVAAATLVTAGGVGVYAAQGDKPAGQSKAVPLNAKLVNFQQAGAPAVQEQYVTVEGRRDPAVLRRINAALRAPADRAMATYRKNYTGRDDVSAVATTTEIGLHTTRLLSVSSVYSVTPKPGTFGNWVKNFFSYGAVTVDLADGKALGPSDVLAPAALTPEGANRLRDRIAAADPESCLNEEETTRPAFRPQDFQGENPKIQITLRPREARFMINMSALNPDVSMACRMTSTDVPVDRIADFLAPRVVAEMRSATPSPSPSPTE